MSDMNTPLCGGEALPCPMPPSPSQNDCLVGNSLAMVYSPCQVFQGIYTPEEGLCRGTIFMELEKPFWGARRVK